MQKFERKSREFASEGAWQICHEEKWNISGKCCVCVRLWVLNHQIWLFRIVRLQAISNFELVAVL